MTTPHALLGRRRLLVSVPARHALVVPGNSDVLGAAKASDNPAGRDV